MNDLNERDDELAGAEDVAAGLQERVEELEGDLVRSDEIIDELRADLEAATEAPREAAGDAELRGLASTVRDCQRTGHPDLATHLDNLLKALGT